MNKGLKHCQDSLLFCSICCKRNTDLMNKGLKHCSHCCLQVIDFILKETLT